MSAPKKERSRRQYRKKLMGDINLETPLYDISRKIIPKELWEYFERKIPRETYEISRFDDRHWWETYEPAMRTITVKHFLDNIPVLEDFIHPSWGSFVYKQKISRKYAKCIEILSKLKTDKLVLTMEDCAEILYPKKYRTPNHRPCNTCVCCLLWRSKYPPL